MTNELFMKIVSAIITIIIALVSAYVIPWLKTKVSKDMMEKIIYYTDMAVRCAEQIYTVDQWAEKKAYVTEYITNLCNNTFGISLSEQDIDVLIEGAVNEIKKG